MVTEPDRDAPVGKQRAIFACPRGHEFTRSFALDAEVPHEWECAHHGTRAPGLFRAATDQRDPATPGKTHWDHVLERRTEPDLEAILNDALARLARDRGETASIAPPHGSST
ncbi:RNA polymerase binding protein RbpA [Lentzea atacamensis]|uniref:RNA polymerase-binding protein RbpA n=2 Tax=Lentzea atacamensis TaxID=531938 RepID=A0ABX9DW63_9PSEU|nr:RNA polymerase binding protein RbpA [Lentzea atacamensis]